MAEASDLPIVHLHPGEMFLDRRPHLVTTLLGSCVAVCLWDSRLAYGGMTHSVLPAPLPGEVPSPRHTRVAVSSLLQAMLDGGSRRGDLRAKLFGGASLYSTDGGVAVGAANVRAARAALRHHRIPLLVEEVEGGTGVVIKMDTGRGHVWLRRMAGKEAA